MSGAYEVGSRGPDPQGGLYKAGPGEAGPGEAGPGEAGPGEAGPGEAGPDGNPYGVGPGVIGAYEVSPGRPDPQGGAYEVSPGRLDPQGGAGPGSYPARRIPGRPATTPRRRLTALTIGVATAVVIAAAAFASTLFASDATPKQALPDAVDTGVPYSGAGADSATPSATATHTRRPAPSHSASASASAPLSPSASASASASRAAAPSPSKSAPAPSASASGPDSRTPQGKPLAPPPPGQTLRRGDSGPGVLELQERLAQLGLYTGSADGGFGSRTERAVRDFQSYLGITDDPAGVYGPGTRQALESMTDRP
ncbi:peptidoglycan-binding protein [Streptomyces sp. NPDC006711]|uniref:peptidoglycan-binding domain-containing protein n=1 Tax=Streptomyces sp. NPDC006711 TaxID=3364762 RepID=UPI00368CA4CF